jgi:hypothetical protein
VPLRILLEETTVAAQAAALDTVCPGPRPAALVGGMPRPAPLSFGQERLWFLDRLDPGRSSYHVQHTFRLTGPVDRSAQ